jgi:hypothetical protein
MPLIALAQACSLPAPATVAVSSARKRKSKLATTIDASRMTMSTAIRMKPDLGARRRFVDATIMELAPPQAKLA